MKSIWKFPVEVTDEQSVKMPVGAQALSVQVQGGQVCLWALVDTEAETEERLVQIFGTGHPFANEGTFVETFQMQGGAFVKYATLTELLRFTTGSDSFSWLNQPSGHYLREEPIRSTDCDRLLEMGIKTTPGLAQTSVDELSKDFAGDEFAMNRLHAFLTKRGLAFGMKFLPRWG